MYFVMKALLSNTTEGDY